MTEGELKQSIDKLVEELRFVVKSEKEIEDIIQVLDSIVNVSKTSIGDATEFTIDDVFLTLLRHESKEIIAKTAKAIAEIAKSESGREKCTSTDLVTALLDLLKDDRVDVLTQTSRALGNICYENENGKKFVEDKNGLMSILAVLTKSVALKNVEGAPFLRNVAAGLLLNFLVDRSSLHKEALKQDTVPIICSILEIDGTTGGEAAMHALLILGILNDASIMFLNERLIKILVDILTSDASSELSEMCLELLHGQAEDENVKLLLAKGGICELLLKHLEKHSPYCTDEETRSMLKIACNIIVLILTGDESMNYLYDNSNGVVYKKLVEWLKSEDKDLQITAVLAMGEAAIQLGKKTDLLKKVIEWCNVEDHPGVQGEANRLVAWLINNSRSKEVALLMIEHGAVAHLTKMLTIQNILMQNEALISLVILTTTCLCECEKPLLEADIGGKICTFFNTKINSEIPIMHNVLSLLDNIINSDKLREHLGKTNLKSLCQNINQKDAVLQKKLQNIADKI
ncbi:visceral mesodermal armadillo-repeats isoform X2 [Calliopsis andreniformis]|uniref:visceral mesodermal armadillo-repeats isoform X2 n=1 Tax=Calliopsis andreniformis TaxID=337506 RepID=UPI003FCD9977